MGAFEHSSFADDYTRLRTPPAHALAAYRDAAAELIALSPGSAVADAGAGTGLFSAMLLEAGATRVYAIEPAAEMARALRQQVSAEALSVIQVPLPLQTPLTDVGLVWVSDVGHLFAGAEAFLEALDSSFPRASTILIRQTSPTILALADWVPLFPEAFTLDSARHFEVGFLLAAAKRRGWRARSVELVDETRQLSSADYLAYYRRRPFSGLHLISDAQFAAGISKIEALPEAPRRARVIYRWLYCLDRG